MEDRGRGVSLVQQGMLATGLRQNSTSSSLHLLEYNKILQTISLPGYRYILS